MARPHKVLFVIPNLQQGGAERQILQLANRLPERFQPSLCLFDDNVHYKEELARLPMAPRVVGASRMGPAAYRRLVAIIREEKPDIVQTYRDIANFWGRLAALKAGVPVVVTSVRNRALNLINVLTERWLARLKAGDFFGEMCILETLPRVATVQAVAETRLFSISSLTFLKLYDAMPAQYGLLLLNLARDLSRRLRRLDEAFAARH